MPVSSDFYLHHGGYVHSVLPLNAKFEEPDVCVAYQQCINPTKSVNNMNGYMTHSLEISCKETKLYITLVKNQVWPYELSQENVYLGKTA